MHKLFCIVFLLFWGAAASVAAPVSAINWQPWSTESFAQAKAQNKPVYLYLEAVWCHWCHVMQQTTFSESAVVTALNNDFIPIRVDHDARPALANRYRAWGWPAQVWFAPDGGEIAKRAGYIAPENFQTLLSTIAQDPSAVTTADIAGQPQKNPGSPQLSKDLRQRLQARHRKSFDAAQGGLDLAQKFLDADSIEYDLRLARTGDAQAQQRARQTLDAALALIDPVWGGAYQYSTHSVWSRPHYEKIMRTQARYLRIYALAYMQFRDPDYRAGAQAVQRYLDEFWQSPEGGFYTSQDADLVRGQKAHDYFALDDAARRDAGMPRIDKHRYAQENGLAIEGLLLLHQATGDPRALNMARQAMQWVLTNRRLEGGGFKHGVDTSGGPYLGDNLALARALLEFYRATGTRDWLAQSQTTADFIAQHFERDAGGFYGTAEAVGPLAPTLDVDENIAATRYFNLLAHYSGNPRHAALARHGMRYLATPKVATRRINDSGILLADTELASDPLHLAVVGPRQNDTAAKLYAIALKTPGWYKRVEWWDRAQGPLPNHDVEYPDLGQPAGFFCEDKRCSLPQFSASGLSKLVERHIQAH